MAQPKYTVERTPTNGWYVANNEARCISAGPYHTRQEADEALTRRLGRRDTVTALREAMAAGAVVSVYCKGKLVTDSAMIINVCDTGWFEVVYDSEGGLPRDDSYHLSLGDYAVA